MTPPGHPRAPEPPPSAGPPGLEANPLLEEAGQATPLVLAPVAQQDFERPKRRIVWACVILAAAAVGTGVWFYQRSVDPIRAQEAFDSGERLLRIARYEQAILSFDRAIALKPDFAQAFMLRGRAKVGLSKPVDAIPDFTRVIGMRPNDPQGYVDRGTAYLELRELNVALADFDHAIQLKPDFSAAHNLRGVTLRRKDDLEGALEALNLAVSLAQNMNNYFERASTLQMLERHQEAIEDLTRVIEFEPTSGQAYFARAQSYRALGDVANAEHDHHTGRVLDGETK